jgi:hypothetical protein
VALVVQIESRKVLVDTRLAFQNGVGNQLEGDGWLLREWQLLSANNHLDQPVFFAHSVQRLLCHCYGDWTVTWAAPVAIAPGVMGGLVGPKPEPKMITRSPGCAGPRYA